MSKTIIQEFIKRINAHNTDGLTELMSDDHKFVDSLGKQITGKEILRKGWEAYFQWFPDYTIKIEEIMELGNTFGFFGYACGSFMGVKENFWFLPTAWKAVVENGKVSLWQVYADTKLVFEIMEKAK